MLSGLFTGRRATVVPPPYPAGIRGCDILIEFPSGGQFVFNPRAEIAQRVPGLGRPGWFPPVSLVDAAGLHDAILKFSVSRDWNAAEGIDWPLLYRLVCYVWRARLPLEAAEIGALLEHHGVPDAPRDEVGRVFRHCRDVLVFAMGRKPVKKKRIDESERPMKRQPASRRVRARSRPAEADRGEAS